LVEAGLQIVELLSMIKQEDFQMQQWMFLFDGYGMSKELDQSGVLVFKEGMATRRMQGPIKPKVTEVNEICQPYLVRHLSSSYKLYAEPASEAKEAKEPSSPASLGSRSGVGNRGRRGSVLGGKRQSIDIKTMMMAGL
jgi:hypothetical protein